MPNCERCGTVLTGYGPTGMCPRCLLQSGLGEADDASPALPPSPPSRRFGDYELLSEIACGGMGVVYRARQVSLNRIVAVKMMLAGPLARPEFVQRFRAEAEAAASLQHPNIVAIHEVGEHGGQPYFSMDLVDGRNLADMVRHQPLPPRQAAACLKTIAEAVHYAHQRGILHRDLKPSNILIDQNDQPRITDFGLAKRLVAADVRRLTSPAGAEAGKQDEHQSLLTSAATHLTLTGQVLGSPNYLPPEQAEGRQAQCGPPSDVYSLGAVLYHLLTARPPFVGGVLTEVLKAVAQDEPVSPRRLNSEVPRDLETICLKCLEKDVRHRYPTAQDLAEELGRFLRNEPIHARPVGAFGRTSRWCRRKPGVAALTAGLILAFVAGFVGVAGQWRRAERHAHEALRALDESQVALSQANLERARALRISGRMGQRLKALEAVRAAVRLRPSLELRNQAIGALALTDLEDTGQWTPLPAGVCGVTFNALATHYAYVTPEDYIQVCRFPDGANLRTITNKAGRPEIRFSRDGGRLAALGSAKSYVIDVDTGEVLWETHGRYSLALTPDGRRLVRGTPTNMIAVIDLDTGREIKRLATPFQPVHVALSPQGEWLAVWNGAVVEVWNLETGRKMASESSRTEHQMAWNPDGDALAFGCPDHVIRVWSWRDAQLQELRGHARAGLVFCFHPQGDLMASYSWDHTLRLWDPVVGEQLLRADGFCPLTFSPDGQWLAVLGAQGIGKLRLHRSAECRVMHTHKGHHRVSNCIQFSPDSRWLLSSMALSSAFTVWDVASGLPVENRSVAGLLYASFWDDQVLITFATSGVMLWSNAAPASEWKLDGPLALTAPTPDLTCGQPVPGRSQMLLGRGASVGLFDVVKNSDSTDPGQDRAQAPFRLEEQPRVRLPGPLGQLWKEFDPAGQWLASGSWNNKADFGPGLSIWSVQTGERRRQIPMGNNNPCFSPDGRWFLAAGTREYRLFERRGDPEQWPEVWRHSFPTFSLAPVVAAFAPHEPWLTIRREEPAIRILALPSGHELAQLPSPGHDCSLTAWSPDGRWLAYDTRMGARVWDLDLLRRCLRELGLDWE